MFSFSGLYSFAVSVVVLGVLIFVHELGHFLVAKSLNFCILKFSLGFGKKIFGVVRGETEYLLSAFPIGGYVKFFGENAMGDEEDVDALTEEEKERAKDVDKNRNFAYIHPFKRILTVVAGPFSNLVFAALLFTVILMMGFILPNARIGEVLEGNPADMAGLKAGDLIIEVDGNEVGDWEDVHHFISTGTDDTVAVKVERDGEMIDFTIDPKWESETDLLGEENRRRLIGIASSRAPEDVIKKRFGPVEAIVMGVAQTVDYTVLTYKGIIKLVLGEIPVRENLGGPIMIVQMTGEFAQRGLVHLLNFMAVVSISLGVINLMPIPILDGGAIIFYFIEMVRGRPISLNKRLIAQQVGLFLLIALMLFAFYNDIARLVTS